MEKENEINKINKNKKKKSIIITIVILSVLIIASIISKLSIGSIDKKTIFSVGQVATNSDGVSFVVTNVVNKKSLGTGYLTDTTNSNFILIDVTVKNNSNKKITIYGGCANLYNSKNVEYDDYTSLNINYIISEDINVGVSKSFQIAFETPTTTEQDSYILKIGYSMYTSNDKRVSIKLDKCNVLNDNSSESNLQSVSVGKTFSFDDLEIKVNSFNIETGYLFGDYKAKEGCYLVVVNIFMYNDTDTAKYLKYDSLTSKYDVQLYLNDTTKYNQVWWGSGYYAYKFVMNHDSIIAKDKLEGVYCFQVPENIVNSSKLEFRFTYNEVAKQDRIINVLLQDASEDVGVL